MPISRDKKCNTTRIPIFGAIKIVGNLVIENRFLQRDEFVQFNYYALVFMAHAAH